MSVLRQVCGYAAAVSLPWTGLMLSRGVDALQGTPLALSFAVVVCIAFLAGNGPGITSAAFLALAFNHMRLPHSGFFGYTPIQIIHTAVIFSVGLLIASLAERQRVTGNRLRSALESLEARTDALIQAQQGSNSAAWMYTPEDQQLHWAEGGAQVFGRRFSELEELDAVLGAIHPEDRERVLRSANEATGPGFQVEFRVMWPNGEMHWLESRGTASPFNAKIWHGVTVDVTERKKAESALVRSEKLAAIGRLSATIAHEVNNPLEAVTNLLYLALGEPGVPARSRDYLQRADRELARLGSIARRTLSFVRPRTSTGPARVCEVVDGVVGMFQPRCSSRGAEIRVVGETDVTIAVPADDLRQILTNLVSNACDALPEADGLVEVWVDRCGERVSVVVRDNGCGIPAENVGRVFDPFFTTKEDVGTGIGLWVTKDLAESNGGRIDLRTSGLPGGFHTEFRVDFPVAREMAPGAGERPMAAPINKQR